MRPTGVAALVLIVAGLTASPANGAARSIDVQISAHLRSDYRFTYDYVAPISIKRLFRPGRRTLRLRDSHTFTVGKADQLGGTFTEGAGAGGVRTVAVTVRKLG